MTDFIPEIADHGYQKEVIISKTGILYFKVNVYNLDLNFGINKTQAAKDVLSTMMTSLKAHGRSRMLQSTAGPPLKEKKRFNVGLSENRSKTGNTYMIDQFKSWVKDAEKDNKRQERG